MLEATIVTLFSITVKSIKRNFYNYFLYFVSMVFSIMVFFTFNSIKYNQDVIVNISGKVNGLLDFGAVSIAVFSAVFMWYSNTFFTKKRKREMGLYSLLGLQKKQIARMLFYENLIMGLVALCIGIVLGSLFSKGFVMLFLRMMGHFVDVSFYISSRAAVDTIMVFTVLFFLISLHSYVIIYRFKLIELFRAEKEGEKEPQPSVIFAVISIGIIALGYSVALGQYNWATNSTSNFLIYAGIVLTLVIVGTFGVFKSLIVYSIKVAKRNKTKYYTGMNMIGISNLLHRIRGNATMLAAIALLSATTLTAVGMSYSFYYDINKEVREYTPFSYVYETKDINLDNKVDKTIAKYPQHNLLNDVVVDSIMARGKILESEEIGDWKLHLMSEENYYKAAKARGLTDTISLVGSNDAVLLCPPWFQENLIDSKITMDFNQSFRIAEVKNKTLIAADIMRYVLVIKDDVYSKLASTQQEYTVRALTVANQKEAKELTKELYESSFTEGEHSSFYSVYILELETRGMLMFIGAFLGLVFLLATGSIIYFRQLTEAANDYGRYKILKNIGISRREVKQNIAKQICFVFILPLIVGVAHSSVALTTLSKLVGKNFTIPIISTVIVYTLIYLIYYVLTVSSYDKIVNSEIS